MDRVFFRDSQLIHDLLAVHLLAATEEKRKLRCWCWAVEEKIRSLFLLRGKRNKLSCAQKETVQHVERRWPLQSATGCNQGEREGMYRDVVLSVMEGVCVGVDDEGADVWKK